MKIFVENILRGLNTLRKITDPVTGVTARIIKLSGIRNYNFYYGGGALKTLRNEISKKSINSNINEAINSIPLSDEVYPVLVSFDKKVGHLDNHIITEKVMNMIQRNINGTRYNIKKDVLRPSLIRFTVYDKLRKTTGMTILLTNLHGKESHAKKIVKMTMRAVSMHDSREPVSIPVLIEAICDILLKPYITLITSGAQKSVYAIRLTWLLEAAKRFNIPITSHLMSRAQKSFKESSAN